MYSTKKVDDIQVNLTGSGVFDEESTNFSWDYFNRLWSLLSIAASWDNDFPTIFHLADPALDCWNCFFRSRVFSRRV